jgi:hypothetical protein
MIPLVPFLIIASVLLLVNFIFKKKKLTRNIAKDNSVSSICICNYPGCQFLHYIFKAGSED